MAEKKFYVDINLLGNQLKNGSIHRSAIAPTDIAPVEGQIYYNTTDNLLYIYTGSLWKAVGDIPEFDKILGDVAQDDYAGKPLVLNIQSDSVKNSHLQVDAVSNAKIVDGTIENVKLKDMGIGTVKANITALSAAPQDVTKSDFLNWLALADTTASLVYIPDTAKGTVKDNTGSTGAIIPAVNGISADAGLMTRDLYNELKTATTDISTNATDISNIGITAAGDTDKYILTVNSHTADVLLAGGPGNLSKAGLVTATERALIGTSLQAANLSLHDPTNAETVLIDNTGGDGVILPTVTAAYAGVMNTTLFDKLDKAIQPNDVGFVYNQANATINTITLSGLSDTAKVIQLELVDKSGTKAGLMSPGDKTNLDDLNRWVVPSPDDYLKIDATSLLGVVWADPATDMGGGSSSDSKLPTQLAVKTYVTGVLEGIGEFRGSYDAVTDTPSLDGASPITDIVKGDYWIVNVAGNFFAEPVKSGDRIIANITHVGTDLTYSDYTVVAPSFDSATESVKGIVEIATNAEALEGTLHEAYVITPQSLKYVLTNGSVTNKKDFVLIGDGTATTFSILHTFGFDVSVAIKVAATGEEIEAQVFQKDGEVQIDFNTAPASDEFRVSIIG
ncbi:MAG: hypothetical protein KAH32_03840 [Chlamydiia bacterium]|nr:hypothetical protein [Chlamydiia bacterium]